MIRELRHRARLGVVVLLLASAVPLAYADGGAIRFDQERRGYRIAVFTQPTPLRAGSVDVSVLVQDARTGQALSDATVTVELSRKGSDLRIQHAATRAAATYRLLRAAHFELPQPGSYDIRVIVTGAHGMASTEFVLTVAPALPRWLAMWPWLFWPAVPIALYAWQMAAGTKQRRQARGAAVGREL
jgi:hypothetical protein